MVRRLSKSTDLIFDFFFYGSEVVVWNSKLRGTVIAGVYLVS